MDSQGEPGQAQLERLERALAPFCGRGGKLNPHLLTWAVLEELGPLEPAIQWAIEESSRPTGLFSLRRSDRGLKKRSMATTRYLDRAQLMLLAIIRLAFDKATAVAKLEAHRHRDRCRRRKARKLMDMRRKRDG